MMHEQIIDQPSFDAGDFILRPVRNSDAGPFAMYAGDERVARMTRTIPHPFPPGAAELYLASAAKPERNTDIWVIDGTGSGRSEFMGMIMVDQLDRAQSEVSFWVPPAFWNAGIASKALACIIRENPHGDKTLFAEVFQDNPGSARVLTNAGFAFLGDAEQYSVARGSSVPTWTYSRKLDE